MHDKVCDGARLPLVMLAGQSVFFSRKIAARGMWIEDSRGCQVHEYSPFLCFPLNLQPTIFDWPADEGLMLPTSASYAHARSEVPGRIELYWLPLEAASVQCSETPLHSLEPAFSPLFMVAQS